MHCNICSNTTVFFDNAKILNKHNVQYFRCTYCGFVQTEKPYWLNEAYSEAINQSDLGLLSRNILLAKVTKVILMTLFKHNAKFLDYGGGYGVFVRLMRDFGFDFYRYDKFCDNLFAVGYDAELDDDAAPNKESKYELITAFEVFEHFADPLNQIETMLRFSKNILFSTELLPPNNPHPHEWWYYGLDHGQHISLFTLKSFESIARKFSLNFYSNGRSIHLLTEKKIPSLYFKTLTKGKFSELFHMLFIKETFLEKDYNSITRGLSKT